MIEKMAEVIKSDPEIGKAETERADAVFDKLNASMDEIEDGLDEFEDIFDDASVINDPILDKFNDLQDFDQEISDDDFREKRADDEPFLDKVNSLLDDPDGVLAPPRDVKDNGRLPENDGKWDGEKGNSKWIPDEDYTPPGKNSSYNNPEGKTWKELLEKYGIDGIEFKNGFPVFDSVSKADVQIEGFETGGVSAKYHNFKKAYIELAQQKGCTPQEVKKWCNDNNYTWHEHQDKKTMQKVPNEIHANIPHNGGRSQK